MSGQDGRDPATSRWVGGALAQGGWGRAKGIHSPEDRRFVGLAAAAIDDYFARNPLQATHAGDRRFDSRLPDYTADGTIEQVRVLNRHLLALDAIDPLGLSRINVVDLTILRQRLTSQIFLLRTLAEPSWNPLWWTPGAALEPLLRRRRPEVGAILPRLRELPELMESARHTLREMPRPHLELAITQTEALPGLLAQYLPELIAAHPRLASDLQRAATSLEAANVEYVRWLRAQIPRATRDPRLGERRYREALAILVGTDLSPAQLKQAALAELEVLTDELRSVSARFLGRSLAARRLIPTALAAVAERFPLPAEDLFRQARESLTQAREFAEEQRLVTVPELDLAVVPMPAVRAGQALAYCETSGPLDPNPDPTVIALASPGADWPPARQASLRREYNAVMLDTLMVHEGVPGHALQLMTAGQVQSPTSVRAAFPNGRFIEGWAVYSEEFMVRNGYPGSVPGAPREALRLQQLKMRIRSVVNTLLDVSYHAEGLTEPEARRLMATVGLAEEGEAVAKWQRVQVSYGQLTTYFLGYREVTALAAELAAANPRWSTRQCHDTMLSHGSVAPELLRELVGLS